MTTPHGYVEKLAELTAAGDAFVAVTLVQATGSTPQDAGSKMLVSSEGLVFGTVGGGRVEHQAIGHAQQMLKTPGDGLTSFLEWNLQTDVGMTCGGTVKLYFEVFNHHQWRIVIFGAGHVARALTTILVTLDCQVTCYDPRPEWLNRLPDAPNLSAILEENLPSRIADLPEAAFVICMTMGHRTDRPILEAIFRQGRQFPYLGVIGSQAKRKVLVRELQAAGVEPQTAERFRCPMGIDIGSNQPGEIAISIAAQLLEVRDNCNDTE